MGIFSRLFRIGKAEANAAIDKLEDPIKMTEQGIRDLKKDLDNVLKALAEVKALYIRSKSELTQQQERSQSYEQKAILLLKKAEQGQLDQAEAERLATEALVQKDQADTAVQRTSTEVEQFSKNIAQLEQNVKKLRATISRYENELKTLKARARVSEATAKINRQLSGIDSSGTISMLEKMKDKVDQQEALSQAYGEIAIEGRSLDSEIDAALDDKTVKAQSSLEALKAKLNK